MSGWSAEEYGRELADVRQKLVAAEACIVELEAEFREVSAQSERFRQALVKAQDERRAVVRRCAESCKETALKVIGPSTYAIAYRSGCVDSLRAIRAEFPEVKP
jgi:phage-related minor tail protein